LQATYIQEQLAEFQEVYAKINQLQELRELVDSKADVATVDKLSNGSAAANEEMNGKTKQLEGMLADHAQQMLAASDALANKADADALMALASALEDLKAQGATASALQALQESVEGAMQRLVTKEQLENAQV
jgi:benzoyl-CoA reductase/2-hydroxyglutaryl-CoA dehydratase subunit BcrC/BadD/HgdB